MDNADQLKPPTGAHEPGSSTRGIFAAWLADYGVVLVPPSEGSTPSEDRGADCAPENEPGPGPARAAPQGDPEAALLIRLSAQKLWFEGRNNTLDWVCRTWIGDWQTDDRLTWRTTDGVWLAQLQRAPNGRRVLLHLWHYQTCVGYQDDTSWHGASTRTRARQPRPAYRSLPLPLPLAG